MNPESFRRLVGNGRYTQEHARFVAYLRILSKAIFENFIRKRFVHVIININWEIMKLCFA